MTDFQTAIQEILTFRDEQNWKQFYTARNLDSVTAINEKLIENERQYPAKLAQKNIR
jgi:hypothetical protein